LPIHILQTKKDADLAAREKYEDDLANEKRETQAKLLAQQEKSQNKQSEIDELRARRYAEDRERKARNEEKAKVKSLVCVLTYAVGPQQNSLPF
jgi:hypothetical protein